MDSRCALCQRSVPSVRDMHLTSTGHVCADCNGRIERARQAGAKARDDGKRKTSHGENRIRRHRPGRKSLLALAYEAGWSARNDELKAKGN